MKTLAEIKKELKNNFKTYTVNTILMEEYEGEFTLDVCAVVTDVYNNFDREYITLEGFESEAKAMKHGKMLATKFACKFEISNC
jgi:hypothetical protein